MSTDCPLIDTERSDLLKQDHISIEKERKASEKPHAERKTKMVAGVCSALDHEPHFMWTSIMAGGQAFCQACSKNQSESRDAWHAVTRKSTIDIWILEHAS